MSTVFHVNEEIQAAVGKVKKRCKTNGISLTTEFNIMRDHDLHSPCILGLDFLTSQKVQIDFRWRLLSIQNAETPVPLYNGSPHAISLLLAITPLTVKKEIRTLIEATISNKPRLLEILYNWPVVCTDKLSQIYSTDEIPVRKRVYLVPVHNQQIVEEEIRHLLDLGIIRLSTSAWAAPLILVPKKEEKLGCALTIVH